MALEEGQPCLIVCNIKVRCVTVSTEEACEYSATIVDLDADWAVISAAPGEGDWIGVAAEDV